ncbi:MAG: hypothetical protein A3E83_02575 [Gammaproteobacteria bacterium RIFCSPHIGHO2_12_FULL_41_20]|nr:MAG: hypothetical protein A3E83_02575 [Gammaproteobacteria bacterium RIFCSPHIGHO2_12_FULL_41_20]
MINSDRMHNKLMFWSPIVAVCLLLIAYVFESAPKLDFDSTSYIFSYATRPPIYPTFVWLFRGFGKHQLEIVMWVQCVFSLLSLLYISRWLHKHLLISGLSILFILLLTVSLIFIYYQTLQTICSEAIAFPVFIVTFSLLVECFYTFNIKKLILLVIFTNILILTRAQFYYFYFLFMLLVAWYGWKKIPIKKIFLTLLIMILSITATAIINRSYHLLKHGHFADVPFIGTQLIVQALFLSNTDAAQFFENSTEKNLFLSLIKQLEELKLTKNSSMLAMKPAQGFHATYAYYTAVYPSILQANDSILGEIATYQKEAIALNISKVLYWHAIKENSLFYFWKLISFFGDISIFLFFFIAFFTSSIRIFIPRNGNTSFYSIYIWLSLLTILVNTAFVAIFEPLLPSYSFYSYFLIFCLGGLLGKTLLTAKYT